MAGLPFYELVDASGIIRESGIWIVAYDAQGTRGHVRLECVMSTYLRGLVVKYVSG